MAGEKKRAAAAGSWMTALQVRLALAAVSLCGSASAMAEPTWPTVDIPSDIEAFAIGGEVVVNGLPMRMRGVISKKTPAQVAALFRQTLGQPLVVDKHGTKLIMGRALGAFYTTVQLEPAGSGTRGVLAVSHLGAGVAKREATKESEQRILSRFPAGSTLVSRTTSTDGSRRADYLALKNSLSVERNVEYIKRKLDSEGYTLAQTTSLPASTNAGASDHVTSATAVFFKRQGAEAAAVVTRRSGGYTSIVFNTVTDSGSLQ